MLLTYRLRPIPIASVATSTLHAFAGLLKIAACASFVPGSIKQAKTHNNYQSQSQQVITALLAASPVKLLQCCCSSGLWLWLRGQVRPTLAATICYYAPDLRREEHYKMMAGVCLSLCTSICQSHSSTERPKKPKIGRKEAHQSDNP